MGQLITVFASVTYSLSTVGHLVTKESGIENLTLTGFGNINATGNSKNNILKGKQWRATVPHGGLGADTMDGGDGD
ncbi:MAG UNVERIFIED_CONTAM: hypothetical protein LVR29_24795 [Microcystis novacekii LVE1205-3]